MSFPMKVIIWFLFIFSSWIQSDIDIITIQSVKEIYSKDETLQIVLTNKSKQSLFYYISIESWLNKEWREVIIDINNPQSKATLISQLHAKKDLTISFQIESVFKDYIPNLDTFRLKINFGLSPDSINKKVYSKSFIIEK